MPKSVSGSKGGRSEVFSGSRSTSGEYIRQEPKIKVDNTNICFAEKEGRTGIPCSVKSKSKKPVGLVERFPRRSFPKVGLWEI